MTGHDYVCFIEPLCFYKSTGLLEQAFPGLGVCVCVCVCVCVWFLQEACQLEDSSVVSNWGGDAVSSPPTLMSWGRGRHAGGFCGGQFVQLCQIWG